MKIFVAYKFSEADKSQLRNKLEKVLAVLEKNGYQTFNYLRDRQNWEPKDHPPGMVIKEAFEELKKCDTLLVFVDGPEKSEGIFLEFGFARALGKKTVLLISEGVSSLMLEAVADQVIKFKKLEDLDKETIKIEDHPQRNAVISYEDFQKLDIRIGKILSAEKIENSDKLLKLEVDFGQEKRQIVSGIAQYYAPESLIGMEAPFIVNLEPRVLCGIESAGMILAASVDGKAVLLHPGEEVPPGSIVK